MDKTQQQYRAEFYLNYFFKWTGGLIMRYKHIISLITAFSITIFSGFIPCDHNNSFMNNLSAFAEEETGKAVWWSDSSSGRSCAFCSDQAGLPSGRSAGSIGRAEPDQTGLDRIGSSDDPWTNSRIWWSLSMWTQITDGTNSFLILAIDPDQILFLAFNRRTERMAWIKFWKNV